jgi:hypothetical protein
LYGQRSNLNGKKVLKKPWVYLSLACATECTALYRIAMNAAVWYEFAHRHGKFNRTNRTHKPNLVHKLSNATSLRHNERKLVIKEMTRLLACTTILIRAIGAKLERLDAKQRHTISREAASIWFTYLDAKIYQNQEPSALEDMLNLFRDIFFSRLDIGILIAFDKQQFPNGHAAHRKPAFFGVERDLKALLEHARGVVAELFIDLRGVYYGTLTGCPFFTVLPGAPVVSPPWEIKDRAQKYPEL